LFIHCLRCSPSPADGRRYSQAHDQYAAALPSSYFFADAHRDPDGNFCTYHHGDQSIAHCGCHGHGNIHSIAGSHRRRQRHTRSLAYTTPAITYAPPTGRISPPAWPRICHYTATPAFTRGRYVLLRR
jgi:hypothetical protein